MALSECPWFQNAHIQTSCLCHSQPLSPEIQKLRPMPPWFFAFYQSLKSIRGWYFFSIIGFTSPSRVLKNNNREVTKVFW